MRHAHFQRRLYSCIVIATLYIALSPMCGKLHAASVSTAEKQVVVVQSYNQEYIWTQRINEGIKDGLHGSADIEKIFYMDAKRNPSAEHLEKSAKNILTFIDDNNPDIVVCVDDVAQEYLCSKYLKGRKSPQVIFCGVNAPLSKYGYPAENVSGVRERWHYRDAFSLMKKIIPSAQTVAFLVEDSESGGYVLDDLLQEEKANGAYALDLVGAERIKTLRQWKDRILYYKDHADVLALGLYNSLLDEETGKVADPDSVMQWTNSVIKNPTIGFSDIAKRHGILCGILESGHEQGYLAGKMAAEVLERGVRAGDLPVRINDKGVVFFNLKTAERLGIQIPYRYIEAASEVAQ